MSRYLKWGIVLNWAILVFVNYLGPQSADASAGPCTNCIENSSAKLQSTEIREYTNNSVSGVLFSPVANGIDNCPTTFEEQVILLINVERSNVGLSPLTLDVRLQSPARWFSNDIIVNGINLIDPHRDSNNDSPEDRVTAAGYDWNWVGETIIWGFGTALDEPKEIVQGWMNSAPHMAILLHATPTHVGVGYAHDPLRVDFTDVSVANFGSTDDPRQSPPSNCDPGFFQSRFPFVTK